LRRAPVFRTALLEGKTVRKVIVPARGGLVNIVVG
jgi:hypothetical protein